MLLLTRLAIPDDIDAPAPRLGYFQRKRLNPSCRRAALTTPPDCTPLLHASRCTNLLHSSLRRRKALARKPSARNCGWARVLRDRAGETREIARRGHGPERRLPRLTTSRVVHPRFALTIRRNGTSTFKTVDTPALICPGTMDSNLYDGTPLLSRFLSPRFHSSCHPNIG